MSEVVELGPSELSLVESRADVMEVPCVGNENELWTMSLDLVRRSAGCSCGMRF